MRVLIAEDEAGIARALQVMLEKANFCADLVHNGQEAWEYMKQISYDVVVLDIMMPKLDGLEVVRRARKASISVPILLLTAKAEIEDRVLGLETGADDYLTKPFSGSEFVARVKALSRRSSNYTDDLLTIGLTTLNLSSYQLSAGNQSIRLNHKEFQLMELFMKHPNHVFSTDHLMERIWEQDTAADASVVWTYIGFLRKKLKQLNAGVTIQTVRGAGYLLEEKIC